MNSVEKIIRVLFLSIVAAGLCACGGNGGADTPKPDDNNAIVTDVKARTSVLCTVGQAVTITAAGAETTDVLVLKSGSTSIDCEIASVTEKNFKFIMSAEAVNGTRYDVWIRRGDREQELFKGMLVSLQSINLTVEDKPDMNLKGKVYCGSEGVKDVLVTDGVSFTKTDADGNYWLQSDERYEVVYIVLPSGYEVTTSSASPNFWASTDKSDIVNSEQHNFELLKVDNDSHRVLVATDIHLSNQDRKPNNLIQFKEGWVKEICEEYAGAKGVYCLNLGDYSWDAYWYSYNCDLKVAKNQIASLPIQFWSTMGNHDNDGHTEAGEDVDLRASGPFRQIMGPTHISMNFGKVHYILIDNIIYKNSFPGETPADPLLGMRDYKTGFREDMIEWVRQDLSYVDKNTPILVGMHIPMRDNNWYDAAYGDLIGSANRTAFLDLFKDYKEVDFISGHTHYNRMSSVTGGGSNMYEHNIAAVCGIWWQNSQFTGGNATKSGKMNMCSDGTPSGYYIYDVNGTSREWHYKAVGERDTKQFKSYDMNEVKRFFDENSVGNKFINAGQAPNSGAGAATITWTKKAYGYEEPENTVWINVWGYEHDSFAGHGNWSIEVTENGKKLTVEDNFSCHDPLAALIYEMSMFNQKGTFSASCQSRSWVAHMFKVQASSKSSTLRIRVTDRFGNVYEEVMERPKKFWDGNRTDVSSA